MLRRLSFGATALAITLPACSSTVETPSTGGAGGMAASTSSTGSGAGGNEPIDAGDAGDAGDAQPDAPPAECVTAADCPPASAPCTAAACVEGTCTTGPGLDFSACDDGNQCTENDYCLGGACTGTLLTCPAAGACTVGVCDPSVGCTTAPGNDGTSCDDGDPCTGNGSCGNGVCQKGVPLDCSYLDGICTQGVCDAQMGCVGVAKNDGAACDDNLFCTVNDHCLAGVCVGGGPNTCPGAGACFVGVCYEAAKSCTVTPGNDGAPCDDGNICTASTVCLNGACVGGIPANNGAACDDGSACTSNTVCQNGVCGGGQGPIIYFADDFRDNSKGWILGMEWQIGPAQTSSGQQTGNPDPAQDHSTTSDNGVAGVQIGGNAIITATQLHGYYYLTSPPFDTSGATGSVVLGFYRWLNSDFGPYMTNIIEVWNGTAWVQVWKSGTSTISDATWLYQSYDITASKNAAMQIRFGFDIEKTGVFKASSWNIDDVQVASAACP